MSPVKKRILHILTGGKEFNGVCNYLYQYYKHMDRSRIAFDFLFCRDNNMESQMNDPIFKDSLFIPLNAVTKDNSNDYKKLISGIRKALNEHQYDIVIVNTSVITISMACLLALPKRNKPVFIVHAHNKDVVVKSSSLRGKKKQFFRIADNICKKIVLKKADYLFACSKDAGRFSFGEKILKLNKFQIINNAIDTEAFVYKPSVRQEIRRQFNLSDGDTVYGNVGKLSFGKNQMFLIDVFYHIYKSNPNSKLWLIGEGPDREALQNKIHSLALDDSVMLLGQRSDVNNLMQAMDCFIFTSLSEGLGIVAIEAQASGLKTIISDGVPKEVTVTDLVTQIPLSYGAEKWAALISGIQTSGYRIDTSKQIINSGYDIKTEAKRFTDLLEQLSE